jgi:hypothetical protein
VDQCIALPHVCHVASIVLLLFQGPWHFSLKLLVITLLRLHARYLDYEEKYEMHQEVILFFGHYEQRSTYVYGKLVVP